MKFVKIILYIILFFVSFISHCQTDSSYYFKRISIEHGLSQSGVTAIVRDHKGILWIGTRQGINKVERNRIKKYTEYHIFDLYEDTNQKLWALTDKGILLYEAKEDSFLQKTEQTLFSISANSSGLFFGGYSAIYKYNSNSQTIERLPLLKEEKAKNKECLITQLISIDEDIFLAGTESDGIYLYSVKTHTLKEFIKDASPLSSLYYDKKNKEIYFSIFQRGLFLYTIFNIAPGMYIHCL